MPVTAVPDRFAAEVAALEQRLGQRLGQQARASLPHRPVVLYGSSTVRLWPDPVTDVGREDLVAVGFGGARLADLAHHYDRLVAPLAPSRLIVIAGANDLEQDGADVATMVDRVLALVARARRPDPALAIAVFGMKPSPVLAARRGAMRAVDAALAGALAGRPGLRFVDGAAALVDATGDADPRWYAADGRHLNAAGLARWGRLLAETLRAMDD